MLGKLGGVRGGGAGGVPGQDLGYDTSMARSVEHLWIELVEQVERLWERINEPENGSLRKELSEPGKGAR